MRKRIWVPLALVSLVFALETYAQSRVFVPIINWRYRNSHMATAVTAAGVVKGDTIDGTTRDTVNVPLLQRGGLIPVGVQIVVEVSDAEAGATTADSVWVVYRAGIGGTYFELDSPDANNAQREVLVGNGNTNRYGRTFVFNTTGAAVAFNTEATVSPYMETLQLLLQADDANDDVRYIVKALGIYEKQ